MRREDGAEPLCAALGREPTAFKQRRRILQNTVLMRGLLVVRCQL